MASGTLSGRAGSYQSTSKSGVRHGKADKNVGNSAKPKPRLGGLPANTGPIKGRDKGTG